MLGQKKITQQIRFTKYMQVHVHVYICRSKNTDPYELHVLCKLRCKLSFCVIYMLNICNAKLIVYSDHRLKVTRIWSH